MAMSWCLFLRLNLVDTLKACLNFTAQIWCESNFCCNLKCTQNPAMSSHVLSYYLRSPPSRLTRLFAIDIYPISLCPSGTSRVDSKYSSQKDPLPDSQSFCSNTHGYSSSRSLPKCHLLCEDFANCWIFSITYIISYLFPLFLLEWQLLKEGDFIVYFAHCCK